MLDYGREDEHYVWVRDGYDPTPTISRGSWVVVTPMANFMRLGKYYAEFEKLSACFDHRLEIKSQIEQAKRDSFRQMVERRARELMRIPPARRNEGIYKFVNCMKKTHTTSKEKMSPLLDADGNEVHSTAEKIDVFTQRNREKYSEPKKSEHDAQFVKLLSENKNAIYRNLDMRISESTHRILKSTVAH